MVRLCHSLGERGIRIDEYLFPEPSFSIPTYLPPPQEPSQELRVVDLCEHVAKYHFKVDGSFVPFFKTESAFPEYVREYKLLASPHDDYVEDLSEYLRTHLSNMRVVLAGQPIPYKFYLSSKVMAAKNVGGSISVHALYTVTTIQEIYCNWDIGEALNSAVQETTSRMDDICGGSSSIFLVVVKSIEISISDITKERVGCAASLAKKKRM